MGKVKILMVGSSSLLGKKFCDFFSNDYEIYSLGKTRVLGVSNHIQCDLMKKIPFSMLPHNVDIMIYLAQANNYKDFEKFSKEIYTINTVRVFELIEYYKDKNLKKSSIHQLVGFITLHLKYIKKMIVFI
ncbi:hypothetical protein [Halarcobacter sp.]|uniref:hypothetical protein n=1 Tax=Halarcobacter sp. TaxID=2321133 RepID=UPI003AFFA7E6